jgi:hypothetical protein
MLYSIALILSQGMGGVCGGVVGGQGVAQRHVSLDGVSVKLGFSIISERETDE